MKNEIKPRIVVFSLAYAPLIGGAEIALEEYIARLPQYEFTVITKAHRFFAPRYERTPAAHVYHVGRYTTWLGRLNNYVYIPLAALKARRLHNQKPFDAAWSMMAAYGGGAAYLFMRSFPRVPVLLTLQEGDPLPRIERLIKWVRAFYFDFFARVAHIQTISTYLAGIARHFGAEAPITVVPNGVDITAFSTPATHDPYKKLKHRGDALVVFSASRLEIKNGVDTLVEALALNDRLMVVIAGAGSMHDALLDRARMHGVADRLLLLGAVPYRELPAYYQAADVFCRPARSEGMGNVFIEAFAAGVPVVGTDVGGIADFAKNGENMLVVPPEDPQALVEACVRIQKDTALRQRLIGGGHETATRYDWQDLAVRMGELFSVLLTENNAKNS